MARHWCGISGIHLLFVVIVVVAFGILSFLSCIAAEISKTKENEIKLDGGLCYLPGSEAFRYGIGAIIFLSVAEFFGNVVICKSFCGQDKRNNNATITAVLCVFSWISYGVAVIAISTASSMNREQSYGRGWLKGECYLVRNGVFLGSGFLVLAAAGFIVCSIIIIFIRKIRRTNQERK